MTRFVNGRSAELEVEPGVAIEARGGRLFVRTPNGTATALVVRRGEVSWVSYMGRQFRIERQVRTRSGAGSAESGEIFAPMPGQVVDVFVTKGQPVAHRQKLFVLEAMKTQQAFVAPFDGEVAELKVAPGDQVREGDLLAIVDFGDKSEET